jgi:hypothetical protein
MAGNTLWTIKEFNLLCLDLCEKSEEIHGIP